MNKEIKEPNDLLEFQYKLEKFMSELPFMTYGKAFFVGKYPRKNIDLEKLIKINKEIEASIDRSTKKTLKEICNLKKQYGDKYCGDIHPAVFQWFLSLMIDVKSLKDLKIQYLQFGVEKDCYKDSNYHYLKKMLEQGFPFSEEEQDFLGVHIDNSGIDKFAKPKIAIQAGAQVLWFLKGKLIRLVEMSEFFQGGLFFCLNYGNVDEETLKRWVSKINPIPERKRKRKLKKEEVLNYYKRIVYIPKIFSDEYSKVNFQKLRFAIISITKVLSLIGKTKEEILNHEIIKYYKKKLNFYCAMYVDDWIKETLLWNGSIFNL